MAPLAGDSHKWRHIALLGYKGCNTARWQRDGSAGDADRLEGLAGDIGRPVHLPLTNDLVGQLQREQLHAPVQAA